MSTKDSWLISMRLMLALSMILSYPAIWKGLKSYLLCISFHFDCLDKVDMCKISPFKQIRDETIQNQTKWYFCLSVISDLSMTVEKALIHHKMLSSMPILSQKVWNFVAFPFFLWWHPEVHSSDLRLLLSSLYRTHSSPLKHSSSIFRCC